MRFRQSSIKMRLILLAVTVAVPCSLCFADGFVGVWQNVGAPAHTNQVEMFERVELRGDHCFRICEAGTANGLGRTNVFYAGNYQIIGTNQLSLTVLVGHFHPDFKPYPIIVSGAIVGDTLELPASITSVGAEIKKYRRVK